METAACVNGFHDRDINLYPDLIIPKGDRHGHIVRIKLAFGIIICSILRVIIDIICICIIFLDICRRWRLTGRHSISRIPAFPIREIIQYGQITGELGRAKAGRQRREFHAQGDVCLSRCLVCLNDNLHRFLQSRIAHGRLVCSCMPDAPVDGIDTVIDGIFLGLWDEGFRTPFQKLDLLVHIPLGNARIAHD